jgi:hypothetical protein
MNWSGLCESQGFIGGCRFQRSELVLGSRGQGRRDGSVRYLLVARRDVLAGLAPPGRNRTRDREDIELGN